MAGYAQNVGEGRYRLKYKDHSRYVEAKSDRAAETLLAKFITEVENGNFSKPSKITFGEFVKKWLKNYAEVTLAPKTLHRYQGMLDTRILPLLGDKNMGKIKPMELLEFYNGLKGKHYFMKAPKEVGGERIKTLSDKLSDQTIKHHHRLISAIYERAIKWNVYQGINPANFVDAPKVEKKKAKFYDLDQIAAMLSST
jgi:integrase